ncbi:MAG: hypothetical protein ACPGVD_01820 [Flavobacteriales bacterium]
MKTKTSTLKAISLLLIAGTVLFLSFKYVDASANSEKINSDLNETSTLNELKQNLSIPSIDVKHSVYKIDSKSGGKITHKTGSEIEIPAESFVTKSGEEISGEVEIHYREFHNQMEIFGSGIPMEYDSAGENLVFESAGMIEIFGIHNGDTLAISPDKELAISMHSNNPETRFNLYYLDQNKTWVNKGKDSISKENGDLKSEEEKLKIAKEDCEEQKEIVKTAKKEVKAIKKSKPEKPREANPKKPSFSIDFLKDEFPEFSSYEGTIFELVKEEDYDEEVYKTEWENVKLKQDKNEFKVELKKGKLKKLFDVIPVLEGKNYKEALKKFKAKFKSYSTKLNKRLNDEKIAQEELKTRQEKQEKQAGLVARLRKKFNQNRNQNWAQNRAAMNENWGKGNFEAEKQNLKIKRFFKVDKFGAWNSDQPLARGNKRIVCNAIVDNRNKKLTMNKVSVLELNRNRVISIIHWEQLTHDPKTKSIMIGVTNQGQIVYSQELNSVKGGKIKVKKLGKNESLETIRQEILN